MYTNNQSANSYNTSVKSCNKVSMRMIFYLKSINYKKFTQNYNSLFFILKLFKASDYRNWEIRLFFFKFYRGE